MLAVIHQLHYVHDHQLVTQFKVVQVPVLAVIHLVAVVVDKFHFHHRQGRMHNRVQVQNNKYQYRHIMLAVLVPVQRRAV